jgi:hypothetical protein
MITVFGCVSRRIGTDMPEQLKSLSKKSKGFKENIFSHEAQRPEGSRRLDKIPVSQTSHTIRHLSHDHAW